MSDIRYKKTINKVLNGVNIERAQKESGYSPAYAHSHKIQKTKRWKDGIKEVIDDLEQERESVISEMEKKRKKANYRDLIDAMDKLTKNIQLLSGKETKTISFSLVELLKKADEENI